MVDPGFEEKGAVDYMSTFLTNLANKRGGQVRP